MLRPRVLRWDMAGSGIGIQVAGKAIVFAVFGSSKYSTEEEGGKGDTRLLKSVDIKS